ncbi:MAG: sulfotransferase domain-containing protein [Pseudomonadota bacterium]
MKLSLFGGRVRAPAGEVPASVSDVEPVSSAARNPDVVPAPPAEKPRQTFSVLIVTIPKSGTVYMNTMFREGLGLDNCILSNRYFPEDQLRLEAMPEFAKGGYFASAHIDASAQNLQLLDEFVPKWIVHFRDPRSVLLSWLHHVERLTKEGKHVELLRLCPAPPRELHGWTFERRIDWHIDHFLPHVVQWMTNWLDVCARWPGRILVTEFASLKEHEDEHSARILEFLEIDRSLYVHRSPEKAMDVHFRTGTYDEWRQVFTSQQVKRASEMIPDRLSKRFGWPQH